MKDKSPLGSFSKNINSQWGEDGIIDEIFNRIGVTNKICFEFGAWDGFHYSNTCNLWNKKGWSAILIEGDAAKTEELKKNTSSFKDVQAINQYVESEGPNSLNNIFIKLKLPYSIDLLSIDIDGDDIYTLECLKDFKPRVIIIEYNPTIPLSLDIKQEKGNFFGSSALAILKVAKTKGYKLTHMTDTNIFLVTSEEFSKLGFNEPLLEDIFPDTYITYAFSSYDGQIVLSNTPVYRDSIAHIKEISVLSLVKSIFKIILKKKIFHYFQKPNEKDVNHQKVVKNKKSELAFITECKTLQLLDI